MRDDGWYDGEIIVLSSLRKIILSSEYYEPAYDTLIGNLRTRVCARARTRAIKRLSASAELKYKMRYN